MNIDVVSVKQRYVDFPFICEQLVLFYMLIVSRGSKHGEGTPGALEGVVFRRLVSCGLRLDIFTGYFFFLPNGNSV